MALPRIDIPHYPLTLSDGQEITFRPFLVKEEKILLIAIESENTKEIIGALLRIIENCTMGVKNHKTLPVYDTWYILLNVRAKSKGELVQVNMGCNIGDCNAETTVDVDVTKATLKKGKTVDPKIKINDTTGIVIRYPTLKDLASLDNIEDIESQFQLICNCIDHIYEGDTIYSKQDSTPEELSDFLDSLPNSIFQKIKDYMDSLPVLTLKIKYKCSGCKKDHDVEVTDFQTFLN